MSRSHFRYCRNCEELHQVERWPHNCMPPAPQRSDHPSPYVVSDYLPGGINGLYHHGVTRRIDSKAAYRVATKQSGCVEVGNEMAATKVRTVTELKSDVIESSVNEALHRQGVSSECDVGEIIV